ncbi:ADP-ribose pyrophosphatase YjhB, NUDIX family [Desulfacinum infernum DSM 9756]|jgi:8-oxo-dGTP pyrophosphatase MutT (NUDIX family)|uniref:GDP-mannose pyrophosphatase n=1 Tax=Desulfacinum infernum DSM 9756 TaxID=1121391 RepID=A0A1M5HKH0_9BACT|nr:NUDIX hydrolase [Desulfacinum infernum]SHG16435.1 ADP-ribose pyrophosphatase YjhB, NUDIX family [Desulfacinum infernum DSM 9756]
MAPRKWTVLSSERWNGTRIVGFRKDRVVSPRTGREHDVFVLESPAWVNVIPITADSQVVLVRQYRHGIRDVTLEIPGGVVEDGDTPEEAARRELREETGYEAESLVSLGYVQPNPAIQSNLCHTFVALRVRRTGDPSPDDMEDIEVVTRPLAQIPALIDRGEINHALIVAAFCRFFLRYRDEGLHEILTAV